uniref:Uncharacterized protein n=1 Tax=Photinus pyralis TaxID=7054 RepID=A0A1Y1ND89_PHOPY
MRNEEKKENISKNLNEPKNGEIHYIYRILKLIPEVKYLLNRISGRKNIRSVHPRKMIGVGLDSERGMLEAFLKRKTRKPKKSNLDFISVSEVRWSGCGVDKLMQRK